MQYSTTEFEDLYHRCFPPSMRLAMSLLHEEDEARDVVQEVFIKLWESEIRIANPQAFVIRAVRNASLNRLSQLDTREKVKRRLSLEPPPEDFEADRQTEKVDSAIKQILSPRQQQVVEKIYAEGLSYKDAAESLGVTVAAVNKNIVEALRKLRSHFKTTKS